MIFLVAIPVVFLIAVALSALPHCRTVAPPHMTTVGDWLFGIPSAKGELRYGRAQAHSTFTWLLGIIIGQGVAFATSVQLQDQPFFPVIGYLFMSGLMLIGVALVLNSHDTEDPGVRRQLTFDHGSIVFGRWVQVSLIVLASLFLVASYLNAIPGQKKKRVRYTSDTVPCFVDVPGPEGFRTGFVSASGDRAHYDAASLQRWKDWIADYKGVDGSQKIIYVETYPFDTDYQAFSSIISVERQGVEFVDAFALFVRGAPPNSLNPPYYKALTIQQWDRASIQEINLPMLKTGAHLPILNVRDANSGDVAMLFVLVKAADGTTKLSDDPSWYNLKLRRVN